MVTESSDRRLELELDNVKEERRILIEEQVFNRQRLRDLERKGNDDRSKRLKDMHECELLKRKLAELEARVIAAEADARQARGEYLEKLQLLETSQSKTAFQERTISAQVRL